MRSTPLSPSLNQTMSARTDPLRSKILIVDDQPSNVRLLDFTLRRAGYVSVTSTLESRQVTTLHLEHRFDLIVLDLQMPYMDGFEVLEQLNEIRRESPVSVLVMTADAAQKEDALAAGADAFLGKPYRLPDVVEQVALLLSASDPASSIEPQ